MKIKTFFIPLTLNLCFSIKAQLPVREEPRHHLVFENEYVRILDVHLKPGDTTEYHLHNTPSVFIMLTSTATGSQLYGEEISRGISAAKTIYYDSLNEARYHRVWNEDKSWFHVNDVELTGKGPFKNLSPVQLPSLKLLYNEEQANIYKLHLSGSEKFTFPASSPGYLLFSLDEAAITIQSGSGWEKRLMKPAHYAWFEGGSKVTITLQSSSIKEFALLQLK